MGLTGTQRLLVLGTGHGSCKVSDITSVPCLRSSSGSHQPPASPALSSQALLAGVDNLAQVAGREAETGTFEKRVVLDEIGLGGRVPRGGASAVPTSVLMPRAGVECPRLGLGLRVGREGPG